MRTVCGISAPLDPRFGGTGKAHQYLIMYEKLTILRASFLVKDACEDIAGKRLKA